MRRTRRGGRPAPRGRTRRRLGTFFFCLGILTVLGVTFVVGALAGRFSLRPTASVASATTVERSSKPVTPPAPELTFYRELTAPLTPRPLPPNPAKPAATREPPPPPAAAELPRREAPAEHGGAAARARAEAATRYTVQVGSYNGRAPAEALRARLAASGLPAYLDEGETSGSTRYRVRIGAYATAEEARQAAVRLASEARVATYVTTR
jgi:cell division protein FtsN